MKKYFLIFLLFSTAGMLYLSFPVSKSEHFVEIKNDKFVLNGEQFYPVTLNYIAALQFDKSGLWPTQYNGYNPGFRYRYTSKDSSLMQLKADMKLIKEMGFNTVRIVGIGEPYVNEKKGGELSIFASLKAKGDTSFILLNDSSYQHYFKALEELFSIVNKAGLKLIFLARASTEFNTTDYFLQKMAAHFKNDTTILAYDLFNEPLYFDKPERNKKEVIKIVKGWKRIIDSYAPHHLVTIGLVGVREVFEWDPNLLDVDFISFHPYEHEPGQVMNEMYWFGKYVKKSWIIGETALAANDDSVTYEKQKTFAKQTLKQAYDCGAIGYSWWQFKDVEWQDYQSSFLGLLTLKGETHTDKGNIPVLGTIKPVAEEFQNYHPDKKEDCICLSNYYNYSNFRGFRLNGILQDNHGKPIEGGVVLAWNEYWSKSYHTITKADGSFELMSSFPFYHWMASATKYTMIRGEVPLSSVKSGDDKIPTVEIGILKVKKLNVIW